MEFKSKNNHSSNWALATTKTQSTAITTTNNSKGGDFKINTQTLSTKGVVPEAMMPMMSEISQGLGVDILDPSQWTKESIIEAKKRAAQLDEKLMQMKELAPCIMKYLSFQVNLAEFQAELVVQACKAKSKIDQAQAKAFVAYYRYLRKAANLEKRVKQQQQIIDAAYTAFESVQDARSNAILSGLNQQARLGVASAEHSDTLKQQRQQILAERRDKLQQMKHDLKTAHLSD
ncbi:hypothetical protein F7734_56230 [Scytonema sp. UIC 10036]|uniref:hypothetical protein n=1 Tax=Scytonema sp. UIC 10036 TaxID=2304196 RepID=UPI0012DA9C8D|nr:hypothetical protein [Scytonema sp. UIC 10036]MUH01126.1 hypothetical protein [Scytonema sp. UIC 10036]